jgi:hypothetical protein
LCGVCACGGPVGYQRIAGKDCTGVGGRLFLAKFGKKITIGKENVVQNRKVTTHVFLSMLEFSVYQLSYNLIII